MGRRVFDFRERGLRAGYFLIKRALHLIKRRARRFHAEPGILLEFGDSRCQLPLQ